MLCSVFGVWLIRCDDPLVACRLARPVASLRRGAQVEKVAERVEGVGDPLAVNSWAAICSRGDLAPTDTASLEGCVAGTEGRERRDADCRLNRGNGPCRLASPVAHRGVLTFDSNPRSGGVGVRCYDSKATSAALFLGWPRVDGPALSDAPSLASSPSAASLSSASPSAASSPSASSSPVSPGASASAVHDRPWPLAAWAVNGPTNQNQPAFSWDGIRGPNAHAVGPYGDAVAAIAGSASHLGQPSTFDFAFELMAPRWPPRAAAAAVSGAVSGAVALEGSSRAAAPPPPSPVGTAEASPSHTPAPAVAIGGSVDGHGCFLAAGYAWCKARRACLRQWETPCND